MTSIAMVHMQINPPAITVMMFDMSLENIGGEFILLCLNFLQSSFNLFTMSGKMEGICIGPFVLSNIFTGKVCSSIFNSGLIFLPILIDIVLTVAKKPN